jgi:DedD protein
MAWRLFGKSSNSSKSNAGATERSASLENASLQALRRQARHRLIGAFILLLAGLICFSWLLDSQPRPLGAGKVSDWSLTLQNEANKTPPSKAPDDAAGVTIEGNAHPPAANAAATSTAAPVALDGHMGNAAHTTATPTPEPTGANAGAVAPKPAPEFAPSTGGKVSETWPGQPKATKLVPEKSTTTSKESDQAKRYTVQVGAFAEVIKAREVRQKLEKMGIKTYTQVIKNAEGRRIRVRVGPFETEAEAEKVAKRIKASDLSASVLKL